MIVYDISSINKLNVNNFHIDQNLSNHQHPQEYDSDDIKQESNELFYM